MKGIVLAGGTGSRLWPITRVISKQLLPVYDKPMIYYPISTLMLAGVREILIITTPHEQAAFMALLGDGANFGISISYKVQPEPKGLAQAYIIAEDFLEGKSSLMVLGDNIFHGQGLGNKLSSSLPQSGGHIFTYRVADPSKYGVLELSNNGVAVSVKEKPQNYLSDLAITGLYAFDSQAPAIAKDVPLSPRGEYEITAIIESYLKSGSLTFTELSRGTAWLDTGNPGSLNDAGNYIRIIEDRTGLKIGCLEEIAYKNGWIDQLQLEKSIKLMGSNSYSQYLKKLMSRS